MIRSTVLSLGFLALVAYAATTSAALGNEPTAATPPRFTHEKHGALMKRYACRDCHPSASNGRLEFPGKNHAPCANSGCHQEEFAARDSTLCYGCHENNLPFAPNPVRSLERATSEYDVEFSHPQHSGLELLSIRKKCNTCHAKQAGAPRPQKKGWLSAMHANCGRCHGGSKPPTMLDCSSCHISKAATASEAPWRVDARFSHDGHRIDVRTAERINDSIGWAAFDKKTADPMGCDGCHVDVLTVEGTPPRPKMKLCSNCHDGKHSFKTTGFECARCHGKP